MMAGYWSPALLHFALDLEDNLSVGCSAELQLSWKDNYHNTQMQEDFR